MTKGASALFLFATVVTPGVAGNELGIVSSTPLDVRMGRLEGAYEQISKRLDSIEVRLDRFDAKFDGRFDEVDARFERSEAKSDGKFDSVDRKFDALRSEMTTQFRSIVALIFGTWITTVLAIFFHR